MASTVANGKPASAPPQNSKQPRRSLRRRRTRTGTWYADGWDPSALLGHHHRHAAPSPLPPRGRPVAGIEVATLTALGHAAPTERAERPLSLGSSLSLMLNEGSRGGGPEIEDAVSEGSPSPRLFKSWFSFFGKRHSVAGGGAAGGGGATRGKARTVVNKRGEGEDGITGRGPHDGAAVLQLQREAYSDADADDNCTWEWKNPALSEGGSSGTAGDDSVWYTRTRTRTQKKPPMNVKQGHSPAMMTTPPPTATGAAAAAAVVGAPPKKPPPAPKPSLWNYARPASRRPAQRQQPERRRREQHQQHQHHQQDDERVEAPGGSGDNNPTTAAGSSNSRRRRRRTGGDSHSADDASGGQAGEEEHRALALRQGGGGAKDSLGNGQASLPRAVASTTTTLALGTRVLFLDTAVVVVASAIGAGEEARRFWRSAEVRFAESTNCLLLLLPNILKHVCSYWYWYRTGLLLSFTTFFIRDSYLVLLLYSSVLLYLFVR